ncbi:MAG: Rrf2 family transcriptional regulator [Clostridia bacterium]|nr:Rrf2 family transcriptional regulator [Clostridia bacterium]
MMISTRGRYAVRMMLDLAENAGDGYVSLKDIASRQGISKKYLEQIIPLLNHAGLLSTARGHQGGYRLSKAPENYTIGEIVRSTEGGFAPVSCLEDNHEECPRKGECATLPVWMGLQKVVDDYLDGITLKEILDQMK